MAAPRAGRPVYQAGTLSGNPVATAAGLATLRLATADVYAQRRPRRGPAPARCRPPPWPPPACRTSSQRAGNLFSVFFVGDGRDRRPGLRHRGHASRPRRYAAFFHAMLDAGRLPAAVRVRGLVRLGGARRRRPRPDRRAPSRAAAQPPRPGRRKVTMVSPAHGRPPAPARRGPQPRRAALRPAARLPPLRARPARWPTGSPSTCAAATSCTCAARRWSAPRRRWSRSPPPSTCPSPPTAG